jgi:hypothetical protein
VPACSSTSSGADNSVHLLLPRLATRPALGGVRVQRTGGDSDVLGYNQEDSIIMNITSHNAGCSTHTLHTIVFDEEGRTA